MEDNFVHLYAITYEDMADWSGCFFEEEGEARKAMLNMQSDFSDSDNELDISAISLEYVSIPYPLKHADLIKLMNNGPFSVVESRVVIEIAYLQREYKI